MRVGRSVGGLIHVLNERIDAVNGWVNGQTNVGMCVCILDVCTCMYVCVCMHVHVFIPCFEKYSQSEARIVVAVL